MGRKLTNPSLIHIIRNGLGITSEWVHWASEFKKRLMLSLVQIPTSFPCSISFTSAPALTTVNINWEQQTSFSHLRQCTIHFQRWGCILPLIVLSNAIYRVSLTVFHIMPCRHKLWFYFLYFICPCGLHVQNEEEKPSLSQKTLICATAKGKGINTSMNTQGIAKHACVIRWLNILWLGRAIKSQKPPLAERKAIVTSMNK